MNADIALHLLLHHIPISTHRYLRTDTSALTAHSLAYTHSLSFTHSRPLTHIPISTRLHTSTPSLPSSILFLSRCRTLTPNQLAHREMQYHVQLRTRLQGRPLLLKVRVSTSKQGKAEATCFIACRGPTRQNDTPDCPNISSVVMRARRGHGIRDQDLEVKYLNARARAIPEC